MNPLRWRKMTWVILIWTILIVVWASSAANATGDALAGGIAVTMILAIWFIGFIILSIIWFMTRPTRRVCPACGHEARKGQTVCKKCGHNFSSTASGTAVAS